MKYYITFGQSHIHPYTGGPMKDHWVEVEADCSWDAMEAAKERFGDYWADCYDEGEFDKSFYPKGRYDEEDVYLSIDELFERKVKGLI